MKTRIWFGLLLVVSAIPVMAQYPCEPGVLEVLFDQAACVRLRGDALVDLTGPALAGVDEVLRRVPDWRWERLGASVPESEMDQWQATAEQRLQRPVYNLNNIYYLYFSPEADPWVLSRRLKALPGVVNAYPVPKPMPVPTPNHEPNQGYLKNSVDWPPTGISAEYAWTRPGGDGNGVIICDLEYSWNYNHVDLSQGQFAQLNPDEADPYADTHHGTAVIGELVADRNGWGVTGICHGATLRTYGTYFDPNPPHSNPIWRMPEALVNARSYLSAGDVMVLEQQWDYYNNNVSFIPVEWWGSHSPSPQTFNSVYAAIDNITGNGIYVVEAAGNGGVDLDSLSWIGDSGAIIVGAGGAYSGGYYPQGDLVKLDFSCYGNRVNLHGWGEDVYTTGYGDLTGSTGLDDMFTWSFAGTSSATPIVAGAVACCSGYWQFMGQNILNLDPFTMRSTLINTGTSQVTPPMGYIGPRPDLENAFAALDAMMPATFITVSLQMPAHAFHAGDSCDLWMFIENPGAPIQNMPYAVVLDVYGSYYFYPSWSHTFETTVIPEIGYGIMANTIIPPFTWPSGTGSATGLWFYAAVLSQDLSGIMGLYGSWPFDYSS